MINPAPFLIRDRGSEKGFIYKVTFPLGSVDGFAFSADFGGKITDVTAMNVASYTLKKNASPVSFPFTVVKGDIISIEAVIKIDPGRSSTFILRAPAYTPQTVNLQSPVEVDVTRHHLFVINYTDQTISVIDTDTETVVSTITLPAGYSWSCLCYNSTNDFIYVFGVNRVCKIDANPASGTFLNVYSNTGTLNGTSLLNNGGTTDPYFDSVYDPVGDQIYITLPTVSRLATLRWDFVSTNMVSSQFQQYYQNVLAPPNLRFTSSPSYDLKSVGDVTSGFFASQNNQFNKGCYVANRNTVFLRQQIPAEYDINSFTPVRSYPTLTTGGANTMNQIWGNLLYAKDYDLVICLAFTINDWIGVIDLLTNTALGTFTRSGKGVGETIARSAVYGAKSKKIYFAGNGTSGTINRVHKLDPALWVAGGKVDLTDMEDGYITVGNMLTNTSPTNSRYGNASMCFNHAIVT